MRVTRRFQTQRVYIPMSLRTIPQDGVAIRIPMGGLPKGERIATSLTLLAMTMYSGNPHRTSRQGGASGAKPPQVRPVIFLVLGGVSKGDGS
jgi:hypothetical protein